MCACLMCAEAVSHLVSLLVQNHRQLGFRLPELQVPNAAQYTLLGCLGMGRHSFVYEYEGPQQERLAVKVSPQLYQLIELIHAPGQSGKHESDPWEEYWWFSLMGMAGGKR